MELKLLPTWKYGHYIRLLIVLNGIETEKTTLWCSPKRTFNRTKWNWNSTERFILKSPLPFNRTKWNWNSGVFVENVKVNSFNRTKWNWNRRQRVVEKLYLTFNRTKWNWNCRECFFPVADFSALLIVLNGIETRDSILICDNDTYF